MESQPLIQSTLPRRTRAVLLFLVFLFISTICAFILYFANVCVVSSLPVHALPNIVSIVGFAMVFALFTMYLIGIR